jgi:hypothetical protein
MGHLMLDDDVASRGPASPARLEQPSQGAIGRRVMTRPTGRAVGRLSCRNCPGCRAGLGATRESRCATCSRPLSAGRRPPPDPERTSATVAHSSMGAVPSRTNHTDAGTRKDPHIRMAESDRNHPSDRNRTTAKGTHLSRNQPRAGMRDRARESRALSGSLLRFPRSEADQPFKDRMPQVSVDGPCCVADDGDELRLRPVRRCAAELLRDRKAGINTPPEDAFVTSPPRVRRSRFRLCRQKQARHPIARPATGRRARPPLSTRCIPR